jgi:hypothetical protein
MMPMKTYARAVCVVAAITFCSPAYGEDLARGQIVDDVQCLDDASQSYALYLPSNFTAGRKWPVILGFDAGGRGRRAVERYQAAAEKYGFIVAGSNNSRNGPWDVSIGAVRAMTKDVQTRFPIDLKRKYTAGMSGGARVAMMVALELDSIAGVLASSAGFPDEVREVVGFPIFGTAGTDDFNHWEMTVLDRRVRTPHRVEYFVGGHSWPPIELATDGVEWMEIQAMKSGLTPKDNGVIDRIFAARVARADAQTTNLDKMRELKAIVIDFEGLKNVTAVGKRATALESQQDVKVAIQAEKAEEEKELDTIVETYKLRDSLTLTNTPVFEQLKAKVLALYEQTKAEEDSSDRRIARRVLTGFVSSSRGIYHPGFQQLLEQIRQPSQPPAP